MEHEGSIIICLRAGTDACIIPGSAVRACARCGREVLVSPSGVVLVDAGVRVECMECAVGQMMPGEKVKPLSAEQAVEVTEWVRAARRARARRN